MLMRYWIIVFFSSIILISIEGCDPIGFQSLIIPALKTNQGYSILIFWTSLASCNLNLYIENMNKIYEQKIDYKITEDNITYYSSFIENNKFKESINVYVGENENNSIRSRINIPSKEEYINLILVPQLNDDYLKSLNKILSKAKSTNIIIDFGEPYNGSILDSFYVNFNQFKYKKIYPQISQFNKVVYLPGIYIVFINSSSSILDDDIEKINSTIIARQNSWIIMLGKEDVINYQNSEINNNSLLKIKEFIIKEKIPFFHSVSSNINFQERINHTSFINTGFISFQKNYSNYRDMDFLSKQKTAYSIFKIKGNSLKYNLVDLRGNILDSFKATNYTNQIKDEKAWEFEEIAAIIIFFCTLAFFIYFVYSWISCIRSGKRFKSD